MRGMKINNIVPMLATGDIAVAVRFYREAFGFEVRDKFDSGGQTWWCELMRDGFSLMLTQHETDVDNPGVREGFAQTTINFYLSDGIEALHAKLAKAQYPVSDLRVTFYGVKEFDLQDPDGYTLLIGQATDEPPTVVDENAPPF